MNPDRSALATIGDLQDLKDELTRSLSAEIGRVANVIMEHTTAQIRGAGDHPSAIEDRLDAHIADAGVHRRPARARRS